MSQNHALVCLILVFLAVEKVSFTKTYFYRKRGSVTMRNYAETFRTNIGVNFT